MKLFAYRHKVEEIAEKQKELDELVAKIAEANQRLDRLNAEIGDKNGVVEMLDMGMEYMPTYGKDDAERIIKSCQDEIARMIADDNIWGVRRAYRIDGSEAKGRRFQKEYCKNLLSGIDGYIRTKEHGLTAENIAHNVKLVQDKFAQYQRKADMLGFGLNPRYLDCRVDMMYAKLDLKIAKAEERERIREEKRRIREQEQLIAEAEKAKRQLDEERKRWEKAFASAISDIDRAEAKAQIEQIANRVEHINERVTKYKSGWVYCLRSEAMPNWCKIGVTRRLDFTRRVYELSNAAVPFDFKVYGVTYANDCFALEAELHAYFDAERVNKQNKHKEFFVVEPDRVIDVMRNVYHCDVHFVNEEDDVD